jgi:hypothetical protein
MIFIQDDVNIEQLKTFLKDSARSNVLGAAAGIYAFLIETLEKRNSAFVAQMQKHAEKFKIVVADMVLHTLDTQLHVKFHARK